MALIKCKECGKEMSDTAKQCPNCGFKSKKKIDKKFIISGSIIVLLIILGVVIGICLKNKPLTKIEQQAVSCVLDFKTKLKNSESLQVHKIKWSENELVEGMIFIYMDVSAQNGFGGNNRHIIRYGVKNDDITYQGSSDGDNNSWEELIAKSIKEGWAELKEDTDISVNRIMKKVSE